MRKLLASCIAAILLCNTLAILVQAQSTPTTSTTSVQNTPITNINGVPIISSMTIKNASYDRLTEDERMAVGLNAINDYLSGKTKSLVIPGGMVVVPAAIPSSNDSLIIPPAERPVYSNMTVISQAQWSQISPMYTSYTLPYKNWSNGKYTNTYVGFGGAKIFPTDTDYGANVSSINAAFNYAYPNTLSNLGLPSYEFLVMHLWGWNQSFNGGSENDIYIVRDPVNQNMIDFDYWVGAQNMFTIAKVSQTDKVTAYITAKCPVGSSSYNQIEMCVYDATTKTWYRPAIQNTLVTQLAHDADVALECVGNFNPCQWKVAENVIAYNVSQGQENLYQYGHVLYAYTPDDISPVAENMYYFDPWTYMGVPNAEANVFLTRYPTGSSPPQHP